MKKTRLLVLTASLILGLGTVAYAELPDNALIVGPNAYSLNYVQTHISQLNDIINNSNGYKDIYYKNGGSIASLFGNGTVTEESVYSDGKFKNLTYYNVNDQGTGSKANYVFSNDKYSESYSTIKADITKTVTPIGYLINIHVKSVSMVNPSDLVPKFFKVLDDSDTVKKIGIPGENETNDDYQITLMTDKPSFTIAILANDSTEIGKVTLYNTDESKTNYLEEGSNNDKEFQLDIDSAVESSPENNGNTSGNVNNNGLLANEGSWIYYSNLADGGKLYKKNEIQSGDNTITLYNQRLCEDNAKFINVVGEWIYYSNYSDGQKIYKIRKDGTGRRIVCRDQASYLNVSGEYIYYAAHQESNLSNIGKLYKVKVDAQNATSGDKISDDEAEDISVNGDVIYFINVSENRSLYSIHTDGTYRHKMGSVNSSVKYATLLGSNIYYITDDGDLYRVSTADQNPTKITVRSNILDKNGNSKQVDDKIYGMNITEDNLYYWSYNGDNKLYKAPINDISSKVTGDKIGDDIIDAVNVTESGDAYYIKSGKLYIANPVQSTDSSGKTTYKYSPVAVNAVKSSLKIISYDKVAYPTENIPAGVTLDNIINYLPDKVTATFDDSSVSEVLVNWDLENPVIGKDGTITYNGAVVGYGSKVQFKMTLVSDPLTKENVVIADIVNNPGTSDDTITVRNLNDGDVVKVYRTRNANGVGQELLGTATAAAGTATIKLTGSNILPDEGSTVYLSRTSTGKVESQLYGCEFGNAVLPAALTASNIKITNYGDLDNTTVPTTDIVDVSDDSVLQEGDRIVIYRDKEKTVPIANVEVELDLDSISGPFDGPEYRALGIKLSNENSLKYDKNHPENNYIYVARNTGSAESEAVKVEFGPDLALPINYNSDIINISDAHGEANNNKVNVNISKENGYDYYYKVVSSPIEIPLKADLDTDTSIGGGWQALDVNIPISAQNGRYVYVVETPKNTKLAYKYGYAKVVEGENLITESKPESITGVSYSTGSAGSGAHYGYTQITLPTPPDGSTFKYKVTSEDISGNISKGDSASSGWTNVENGDWILISLTEPFPTNKHITVVQVYGNNNITNIDSQKIDDTSINTIKAVDSFDEHPFVFEDAPGAENNAKTKAVTVPAKLSLTNNYLWKLGNSDAPTSTDTITAGTDDWETWTTDNCIPASNGQYISIVEVDSSNKAQRFGVFRAVVGDNEAPDPATFVDNNPAYIGNDPTSLNVEFNFTEGQADKAKLFIDNSFAKEFDISGITSMPATVNIDSTDIADKPILDAIRGLGEGNHELKLVLYKSGVASEGVTKTLIVDTTKPGIATSGSFTATGYAMGDSVTLKFSEPVKTSDIAIGNLIISGGHTFGTAASINPVDPSGEYATTFRITLGLGTTLVVGDTITINKVIVTDRAGNAAASDAVFTAY